LGLHEHDASKQKQRKPNSGKKTRQVLIVIFFTRFFIWPCSVRLELKNWQVKQSKIRRLVPATDQAADLSSSFGTGLLLELAATPPTESVYQHTPDTNAYAYWCQPKG
jgi:hypothetical protein